VNNLFEDLVDGCVLLKVFDAIEPGCVNWKKVAKAPKLRIKKVINCNYAVDIGKSMKFSLVGIGGVDITDKNKKLVLAMVWQMMRYYTVKMLASLTDDGHIPDDKTIVTWANSKVAGSGKSSSIKNMKDKSIKTSLFLLDLLDACGPGTVNPEVVTTGANDDDAMNNAKYAISVARKLGCVVFLTWEDITEVKPKMIMTFIASIMAHDLGKSGTKAGAA
jgi:plastin-1